jgi:Tol biopolymer transport system component
MSSSNEIPPAEGEPYLHVEPDLTLTLWLADADGRNARRLVATSGLVSFGRPRFSPDGRFLALGSARGRAFAGAPGGQEQLVSRQAVGPTTGLAEHLNGLLEDIWLIDLEKDQARRLADLDLDSPNVTWSGDGRRIFALGDRGLYAIDPDGGSERIGEGMFHGQLDWLAAK